MRKAEREAKSSGELIKALREYKGWTRSTLIFHLQNEQILSDDGSMNIYSESWLARIERGEIMRTSRSEIELICRVLECTDEQRVKVLSLAANSMFVDPSDEPETEAEFIACMSTWLYEDEMVKTMIRTFLKERRPSMLNRREIFEIIFEILEMVKLSMDNERDVPEKRETKRKV